MVVLESGEAWAFGANKSGQLGSGSVKNKPKEDDVALTPVKCVVEGVASVAAGQDFTAWVSKDGQLLTAGNPQYGVLGHGTDHRGAAPVESLPPATRGVQADVAITEKRLRSAQICGGV